jgi:thioredoxin-like negative regulator of GroEL
MKMQLLNDSKFVMNASLPITEITAAWFERHVVGAQRPVLLALGDNGSRAGDKLEKLLETWTPEVGERLEVVRVNAALSPEFARNCGVLLAPGLALFHQGAVCYQFIGEVSRHELEDVLAQVTLLTHAQTAVRPPGAFRPLPTTEALP